MFRGAVVKPQAGAALRWRGGYVHRVILSGRCGVKEKYCMIRVAGTRCAKVILWAREPGGGRGLDCVTDD